jgi:hypothetical protein
MRALLFFIFQQLMVYHLPHLVFKFLLIFQGKTGSFFKMMHFGAHKAGAAAKEPERKTLFIVRERHRHNGYLVLYCQPESTIFKIVKQDRLIFGHPTFGKDTNTQTLVKPRLRPFKNFKTAFRTAPVNQYASAFIKETKYWNFYQFLFPNKNKRIFRHHKHQHYISHRSMVGHQHIAPAFYHFLLPLNAVPKTHAKKDDPGPYPGQHEKLWICFFGKDGKYQQRRKDDDRHTHKDVKPYAPQCPQYIPDDFHAAKCKNSNLYIFIKPLPLLQIQFKQWQKY